MTTKNNGKVSYYLACVISFFLSLFIFLSLITYDTNDNSLFQYDSAIKINNNILGVSGAVISDLLIKTFGLSSFVIPMVLGFWAFFLISKKNSFNFLSISAFPFLVMNVSVICSLMFPKNSMFFSNQIGGFVGIGIVELISHLFSKDIFDNLKLISIITLVILFFATFNVTFKNIKTTFLYILSIVKLISELLLFILRFKKNLNLSYLFKEKNEIHSQRKRKQKILKQPILDNYNFPSFELLEKPSNPDINNLTNSRDIQRDTIMLTNILKDFNINGDITAVKKGPIVTLYELTPAPGTKNASVIGLSADIARSMSAMSTRISAIPGRDAIGIEIPNKETQTVFLRELIDNDEFTNTKFSLPLVLGKDILGTPVIVDLAKMPHLLVAGTTGSGKSVGINAMILSLLYNLTPEECRLILIDPKMLELSVYKDIPHLLTEVVTDPRKAVSALKWTVKEMESRYELMTQIGVREIESYNQKVKKLLEKGEVIQKEVQVGFDSETGKPLIEKKSVDLRVFPKIVVVVDELADLMITSGKEIEATIQRLSQMARAAGIHLIVATQRPSVDVITGTIKSNFPSRISYQVQSKIDSRTILGEQGGEQLLGRGDLLITMIGKRLLRVHGPFVKTHEVESVVSHLRYQGEPEYIDSVTEDENNENMFDLNLDKNDELYNQAVAIVCREKKASTSFIQRQLQIGYNRAARIIEKMESEGIISAANHVGRREVLVGKDL